MTLVPAQCTKCGASLTLNPTEDAAICPYCNSPFIVQKAINYYTQNNNIKADVVNLYGGLSEFIVRGGRLERYNGASTEVTIPDNVIIIGADAFEGCASIRKIIIPSSVKAIETRSVAANNSTGSKTISALAECKWLEHVEFLDGIKTVPDYSFYGCPSNFTVQLPDTVSQIGAYSFSMCSEITDIKLPNSVQFIRSYAFQFCQNLTDVFLPDSIELIEDYAFYYCTSLKELSIPKNVKYINKGAFCTCHALKSVKFNDQLENIGQAAFYECDSLEAIEIPNNVKAIGENAFYNCASLRSVRIYNKDIFIGKEVFNNKWQEQGLCAYCFGQGKITVFGKCNRCGRKPKSVEYLK